jgi:hypothetical protein
MIASLITVVAAISTGPTPPAPVHIGGLLDNSCRHSVEKASIPGAPALYDGAHASMLHKLADLPDANEEILVNRTVNGCPAPVVVMRNVSSWQR